jgi:tetratricopeptide (TPR) repeat protein
MQHLFPGRFGPIEGRLRPMGSWLGLLMLAALAYVGVMLVRGLIEFGWWLVDRFGTESREPGGGPHAADRRDEGGLLAACKQKIVLAMLRALYRLSGVSGFLQLLVPHRDFGFWVATALGESDPAKRVNYCSKALKLNPGYEPAWGLKAFTLLELKRYDEAIPCFDKVIELRPNAVAWFKKGLCCYHLNRRSEALICLDKALAASADKDRQLFDEASRYKQLLLDSSRSP